ncbi:hypothetical protein HJG60_011072 [Phyllostomus discolor]|uniref:Uncharacterized protein n=1 Tax=Phyllostomus discolor TaxID=89673 RepID=A0A834EAN2_9CHIR|nr:hypothetical protein HJG60_011072 [Phyllostomus discolor]
MRTDQSGARHGILVYISSSPCSKTHFAAGGGVPLAALKHDDFFSVSAGWSRCWAGRAGRAGQETDLLQGLGVWGLGAELAGGTGAGSAPEAELSGRTRLGGLRLYGHPAALPQMRVPPSPNPKLGTLAGVG